MKRSRHAPATMFVCMCMLIALLGGCGRQDPFSFIDPDPPTTREWLDLSYASASSAQRLDLYLPSTGSGPFPLIVWVHGGGWHSGNKSLRADAFQRHALNRGYALASINYRLSEHATFPAQIHDVKTAIRWLRANAAQYRLDGARIGAWGSSAGGHLVALLGTSGGVKALEGASLGHSAVSSRVQAVVDWFGPINFLLMDEHLQAVGCRRQEDNRTGPGSPESRLLGYAVRDRPDLARMANPITYVSRDDPPFLIQHGRADCSVPYLQSELLRDALRPVAGNDEVEYTLLEGVGHSKERLGEPENLYQVFAFFDRHLKR